MKVHGIAQVYGRWATACCCKKPKCQPILGARAKESHQEQADLRPERFSLKQQQAVAVALPVMLSPRGGGHTGSLFSPAGQKGTPWGGREGAAHPESSYGEKHVLLCLPSPYAQIKSALCPTMGPPCSTSYLSAQAAVFGHSTVLLSLITLTCPSLGCSLEGDHVSIVLCLEIFE